MTTTPSSDDIIELQTRLSFLEDTCDKLNEVIARQDRQLMDLQDQPEAHLCTDDHQRRCRRDTV